MTYLVYNQKRKQHTTRDPVESLDSDALLPAILSAGLFFRGVVIAVRKHHQVARDDHLDTRDLRADFCTHAVLYFLESLFFSFKHVVSWFMI